MKTHKILIMLLAALMVSSAFTACSSDQTATNETVPQETVPQETVLEEETEVVFNGITDVDMDGKTFTIMHTGWWDWAPLQAMDIVVEEANGEVLNDAVYNRNLTIQETMNCVVASYMTSGGPENGTPAIAKSIQAGDNEYDIALVRNWYFGNCVLNNYLIDMKDMPHVNFSNPWWNENSLNSLSINGKSYGLLSHISIVDEKCLFVTYFNKNTIDEHGMQSPYEIVESGKWTYDTLFSMAETASADTNGDGFRDYTDTFGVAYLQDMTTGVLASCGVIFAAKDTDNLVVPTFASEHNFEVYTNIMSQLYNEDICFNTQIRKDGYDGQDCSLFISGHSLFQLGGIYHAELMRDMEDDFGMIPFPKYTEDQQRYLTGALPTAIPMTCVLTTNTDLENTGIFMEYYSYLGYRDIMPAFYENLLKGKVARDEISSHMLDLIFADPVVDIGVVYDFAAFPSNLMLQTNQKKLEVASYTQSNKEKYENAIAEFNAYMQED